MFGTWFWIFLIGGVVILVYKKAMESRKAKPAKYGHLIEKVLTQSDGKKTGVSHTVLDDGWIRAKEKVSAFRGEVHSPRVTPVSQKVAAKGIRSRSSYALEDY